MSHHHHHHHHHQHPHHSVLFSGLRRLLPCRRRREATSPAESPVTAASAAAAATAAVEPFHEAEPDHEGDHSVPLLAATPQPPPPPPPPPRRPRSASGRDSGDSATLGSTQCRPQLPPLARPESPPASSREGLSRGSSSGRGRARRGRKKVQLQNAAESSGLEACRQQRPAMPDEAAPSLATAAVAHGTAPAPEASESVRTLSSSSACSNGPAGRCTTGHSGASGGYLRACSTTGCTSGAAVSSWRRQADICHLENSDHGGKVKDTSDCGYAVSLPGDLVTTEYGKCDFPASAGQQQYQQHTQQQKQQQRPVTAASKVVNNALLSYQRHLRAELCEVSCKRSSSSSVAQPTETIHVSSNLSNMALHNPNPGAATRSCFRQRRQQHPSASPPPQATVVRRSVGRASSEEPAATMAAATVAAVTATTVVAGAPTVEAPSNNHIDDAAAAGSSCGVSGVTVREPTSCRGSRDVAPLPRLPQQHPQALRIVKRSLQMSQSCADGRGGGGGGGDRSSAVDQAEGAEGDCCEGGRKDSDKDEDDEGDDDDEDLLVEPSGGMEEADDDDGACGGDREKAFCPPVALSNDCVRGAGQALLTCKASSTVEEGDYKVCCDLPPESRSSCGRGDRRLAGSAVVSYRLLGGNARFGCLPSNRCSSMCRDLNCDILMDRYLGHRNISEATRARHRQRCGHITADLVQRILHRASDAATAASSAYNDVSCGPSDADLLQPLVATIEPVGGVTGGDSVGERLAASQDRRRRVAQIGENQLSAIMERMESR